MTSDPRSQEEKEKAWRQQVFDEMHSSVPEEWYNVRPVKYAVSLHVDWTLQQLFVAKDEEE